MRECVQCHEAKPREDFPRPYPWCAVCLRRERMRKLKEGLQGVVLLAAILVSGLGLWSGEGRTVVVPEYARTGWDGTGPDAEPTYEVVDYREETEGGEWTWVQTASGLLGATAIGWVVWSGVRQGRIRKDKEATERAQYDAWLEVGEDQLDEFIVEAEKRSDSGNA